MTEPEGRPRERARCDLVLNVLLLLLLLLLMMMMMPQLPACLVDSLALRSREEKPRPSLRAPLPAEATTSCAGQRRLTCECFSGVFAPQRAL